MEKVWRENLYPQSERIMRHPGLKKMVSSFEQKS